MRKGGIRGEQGHNLCQSERGGEEDEICEFAEEYCKNLPLFSYTPRGERARAGVGVWVVVDRQLTDTPLACACVPGRA
jgi:hypothetical protein